MNGRVLANAGVFALGIIMIIAGAYGIWHGSRYIQLEWGWASVISGSVALTGGVLTLAIGFVLRRLDALHGALLRLGAAAGAGPPAREREPEPSRETGFDPAMQAVAVNPELPADEQSAATPAAEPGQIEGSTTSQPLPEAIHAAGQGPAEDMVKAAGASDEPELDAAIEELLAEERARPPQQAPEAAEEPSAAPAAEAAGETHEAAEIVPPQPEAPPQRAAGGWRGLFSRKERRPAPISRPSAPPEVAAEHQPQEPQTGLAPEPLTPEAGPGVPAETIPRTGDDWFDRALAGLDEVETSPERSAQSDSSPAADGRAAESAASGHQEHSPAPEEVLRAAPPAAEPAVIGRYTSGNTTYVMFADGSIEAETPTGVLHFASLADLKIYVEGGQ
jgi:hypothetical protein